MGSFGNQGRYLQQVIDVWLLRCTLSPLVDMPTRCGIGCAKNRNPFLHIASCSK
jgi:hypothetical protein